MRIILFRGRPGVGKTTIAHAFSKQTGHPLLCKDDIYDAFADSGRSHGALSRACYAALYRILLRNVASAGTFLVDFPFQHPGDPEIIEGWCARHTVALTTFLVTCSDEGLWRSRLAARALAPAPNQLITDFDAFQALYGEMHLSPRPGELLLDSAHPLAALLQTVTRLCCGSPGSSRSAAP